MKLRGKTFSGLSYVSPATLVYESQTNNHRTRYIQRDGNVEGRLPWKRTRRESTPTCIFLSACGEVHGSMVRLHVVCRNRAVTWLSNFSSWFFYSIQAGMLQSLPTRLYVVRSVLVSFFLPWKSEGVKERERERNRGVCWIRAET